MIRKSQAYYLFYLGIAQEKENTVTGLAKRLNVTVASASNMVSQLESGGYVEREQRKIKLSTQGRKLTNDLRDKHRVLLRWMKTQQLSPPAQVEEDAYRYLIEMSSACVDATVTLAKEQEARRIAMEGDATDISMFLQDGEYELPFTIYKSDERQVSMGDQGFYHPGRLAVLDGCGVLSLRAKTISYNSLMGARLTGRLSSLEYWNGERYVPLKKPLWYEDWQIPICSPQLFTQQEGRQLMKIKIKAGASCGIANMPKSEAILCMELA